jgi:hypothetical protein
MSAKKATRKPAESTTAIDKTSGAFSDEERAAIKERAKERKSAAPRGRRDKADGESAVGERLHAVIKTGFSPSRSHKWAAVARLHGCTGGRRRCVFRPPELLGRDGRV